MAPPPPLEANVTEPPDTNTAPIAAASQRLPWRHTFISLKVRNFRIFAIGHFIAVIAIWMQRIAQDWLVLQLSGSVTAVGITVALQFLPSLFLGPWAGMMADRFAKRKILMLCQSVAAVLAAILAVLALSQRIEVWHVYVIALVLGLVTVLDQPARQVFVNELVGPAYLRNAISVNSTTFQLGGLIGPAVAGLPASRGGELPGGQGLRARRRPRGLGRGGLVAAACGADQRERHGGCEQDLHRHGCGSLLCGDG